jgi:hypothetical protein
MVAILVSLTNMWRSVHDVLDWLQNHTSALSDVAKA